MSVGYAININDMINNNKGREILPNTVAFNIVSHLQYGNFLVNDKACINIHLQIRNYHKMNGNAKKCSLILSYQMPIYNKQKQSMEKNNSSFIIQND